MAKTPENLRDAMAEGLRLAAYNIAEHASDIVGDMDLMQSLAVEISFDDPYETIIVPKITITREHIGVGRENFQKIFDIWEGNS